MNKKVFECIDLWGYFVGKEDMYMRDGLHVSGKGAAVFFDNLLRSMDSGTCCKYWRHK